MVLSVANGTNASLNQKHMDEYLIYYRNFVSDLKLKLSQYYRKKLNKSFCLEFCTKYSQSSSVSRNCNILESNGCNFQFDWNRQRWPVEDDLSISNDSSDGISGLRCSDVFGQPVLVVDDGKPEAFEQRKSFVVIVPTSKIK